MLNSQPISPVYLLSSLAIVVLYYPIIIQDIVTPKVNRTTKITTETFTTYPLVISIALGSLGSQVILGTHSLWSLRLSIRFMGAYFRVFFGFRMFMPRSCFFRNPQLSFIFTDGVLWHLEWTDKIHDKSETGKPFLIASTLLSQQKKFCYSQWLAPSL